MPTFSDIVFENHPILENLVIKEPAHVNVIVGQYAQKMTTLLQSINDVKYYENRKEFNVMFQFIKSSVISIDNFDNSIHYSKMNEVFQNLFDYSFDTKRQIFVVCYSIEALKSFVHVAERHKLTGALYRLGISKLMKETMSTRYSIERLSELLEQGFEVR